MDENSYGILGTIASIVASILILIVLIDVFQAGVDAAFKPPTLYIMASLIAVGVAAYIGYINYAEEAAWHMRNLSPIALMLGSLAIIVGSRIDPKLGGALVVGAYIVEFFVGARLAKDFEPESPIGAKLFLLGVTLFIIGLPLIIVNKYASLLSIIGTIIKTVGLLGVLGGLLAQDGDRYGDQI